MASLKSILKDETQITRKLKETAASPQSRSPRQFQGARKPPQTRKAVQGKFKKSKSQPSDNKKGHKAKTSLKDTFEAKYNPRKEASCKPAKPSKKNARDQKVNQATMKDTRKRW